MQHLLHIFIEVPLRDHVANLGLHTDCTSQAKLHADESQLILRWPSRSLGRCVALLCRNCSGLAGLINVGIGDGQKKKNEECRRMGE